MGVCGTGLDEDDVAKAGRGLIWERDLGEDKNRTPRESHEAG